MLIRGPFLFFLLFSSLACAQTAHVAVAANFLPTFRSLQPLFETTTGHTVKISSASSGTLYAQITHGAPFDVLLSADTVRPLALIEKKLALENSAVIYAQGQLVVWRNHPQATPINAKTISVGSISYIALANPKTAPYGAAALETLNALSLSQSLKPKLVTGENIAQAWQFVATGNADIGFAAYSQLINANISDVNQYWLVPTHLYRPINQMAVQLHHGRDNTAATALLNFLQNPTAQNRIRRDGYKIPSTTLQNSSKQDLPKL